MQKSSPFKFLDAYEKEDQDIFFGRDTEVEVLYQMTYQSNLLLVYGMSGTGKTSIIRCGLANRFEKSDWFDIYVRRQENINDSLVRELNARDSLNSFEDGNTVPQMVHSLYLDHLRPVYLIFDQFEELFILGTEEEQQQLIITIKAILDTQDLPCKIIIVMREEYLAHMSNFEKVVPTLFDKRLRIEPMTRALAKEVILRTARNEKFNIELCYDEIADDIIDKVTEGKGRVPLTYLQVFLDKMYREAYEKDPNQIVFDNELVEEIGEIDDVLESFLDEQLKIFSREVDGWDEALRFLKVFVSDKGTKIPVHRSALPDLLPNFSLIRINIHLNFFVNRRILRPLDDDQYEMAHDSLASKIFRSRTKGIPMPAELNINESHETPFLGFEPYTENFADIFYGRDEELEDLFYKIVNDIDIRTTLVIGPMGVGKTSLIRAGLLPRLRILFNTQYIRCNRAFIDSPEVQQILSTEPVAGSEPLLLKLAFKWEKKLPDPGERKIIVFDQFEEFFIWIKQQKELTYLFLHFGHLLESRLNIDLVLVVRDEFFSQLQDLEAFVPALLEEQVRVKHMSFRKAKEVVKSMMEKAAMQVEDEGIIDKIVGNILEDNGKVNLTYLQLYLERLYREV
ncbi:MAG: ATP-binding protein [Saprospiraceae bacterium]|nr:ATP-binding protein [Saprospiraceae bacterium]MCB9326335.1 ATP-binding protein [Lewinellaceae bacterium]